MIQPDGVAPVVAHVEDVIVVPLPLRLVPGDPDVLANCGGRPALGLQSPVLEGAVVPGRLVASRPRVEAGLTLLVDVPPLEEIRGRPVGDGPGWIETLVEAVDRCVAIQLRESPRDARVADVEAHATGARVAAAGTGLRLRQTKELSSSNRPRRGRLQGDVVAVRVLPYPLRLRHGPGSVTKHAEYVVVVGWASRKVDVPITVVVAGTA